jgi:hypothetical protein
VTASKHHFIYDADNVTRCTAVCLKTISLLDAGTLTVPVIDFQYMRQRVGVGPTGDILDIISSWPPEEQQRAHQAIQEIEEQALRDMQVSTAILN